MERYRVIDSESAYYGQESYALDKAEIERRVGSYLGRQDSWYKFWDVLLAFHPDGVGFKRYELERVEGGDA